jgi:hypothetical protein
MTQYSLTCINRSSSSGSFAVFQKPPATPVSFPLAWLTRSAAPSAEVTFTWSVDYSFVWSETGVINSGVNFSGRQVIPADPDKLNTVELAVDNYGATYFKPPSGSGTAGTLTVVQDAEVVPDRTSVGIGMSGSGTTVVPAAPNKTAVFRLHPNYWVVFGNYQAGEVIDVEDTTGAVEVTYPDGITSRTVTIGQNDILKVS